MQKTIEKKRIGIEGLDQEAIGEGISQTGVGVILTLAVLTGAWGMACLIGGISKASGILELARSWLTAVTGM